MSFELNKLLCAILAATLVYLLASFLSELLYNKEIKKNVELSYYIELKDRENDSKKLNSADATNISKEMSQEHLLKLLKVADVTKGKDFVKKNCSSCHDYNLPIKNKIGPSLANVLNRKIGSVKEYKYSKTLTNIDKKWSLINLYLFLEKPKIWAAGTKMSYRGITDSTKLLNTVKFLRANSLNNAD